jgi:ureidoglycolate lyase
VIQKEGARNFPINDGKCVRFHDLADIDTTGPAARPIVSIFVGEPYDLPLELKMVERHPLGSQAFYPLSDDRFLVIVCDDDGGRAVNPKAFITAPRQGINIYRNVWHGVLTPLEGTCEYIVVDRDGEGNNLETFFFEEPYVIEAGASS